MAGMFSSKICQLSRGKTDPLFQEQVLFRVNIAALLTPVERGYLNLSKLQKYFKLKSSKFISVYSEG